MTVYFVARNFLTPRYLRLIAMFVAAYALSPIDLIPDFIPVLGYVDDLIIVPLGILLVLRLTPVAVLADSKVKARQIVEQPKSTTVAVIIVLIWLTLVLLICAWVFGIVGD